MAKITIFLALLLTLALLAAAEENNVLLTGDVVRSGALSTPDATLVLEGCNLVLYTPSGVGFQSNTSSGLGQDCRLSLNDVGQLVISGRIMRPGSDWVTIWSSPSSGSIKGNYAAVLRPDNVVAIYGPKVFETSFRVFPPSTAEARLLSTSAKNLMFSGEILPTDSELITRDYRFVMRSDCNLALFKAAGERDIWSSNTKGNGENCFARLGHRGELVVADDGVQKLWSSNSESAAGEYVLVLHTNGRAAIYGPIVWSTPTNPVLLPGFSVV